jgi:DNA helicase-2/ATP-dependent DNA helicase PcrA
LLADTVARIRSDETLRSDLQERFQYVLADEHQDANALQHELLRLFAYDDFPNLFVVGDDKQAIYRFQGAEADAFRAFEAQFPRAATITLASSFRSYQTVLDAAHAAIAPTGTHAPLTAVRGAGGSVSLIVADDPLDERARVAQLVHAKIAAGVPPHEIAVIARTNDTGDAFAAALSGRGVPVLRAGDVDLLSRPLVRSLTALMSYAADPTLSAQLRTALLAPWWQEPLTERLLLLKTSNDAELFGKMEARFPALASVFTEGIARAHALGPGECFSYLFSESGARDYFLSHAEHVEDIALVRKLLMHIEEAAYGAHAENFAEAFAAFSLAFETNRSPLKVSVTEREGAVTVITAHKAKGMEFSCVIIPDCTESAWEGAGRSGALPSPFAARQSSDDARRLFYVALTRAKDEVFLSYAKENAEGRERVPTSLIPESVPVLDAPSEPLPLLHAAVAASELVQRLTNEYLADGRLSPSAINEYMESPATFFARRVLRISEPPSLPLAYGNAVHAALAALFSKKSDADIAQAFQNVFARSLLTRDATFEKVRSEAWQAFLSSRSGVLSLGEPKAIEKTLTGSRVVDGVPVSFGGKVDALLMTSAGLVLADFKTGSAVSASNAGYARQLRLYAELCALAGEPLTGALLVGISDKGIKEVPVSVSERADALQELDTVVREMRAGEWRRAAPSEYDALLALLG